MKKTIIKLLSIGMLYSSMAAAKNLTLDVSAATGESDNALKTFNNTESEKQSRYTASVMGLWDKQWIDASVQYTAYKEDFADDSQTSSNYIQGDSSIKLGNTTSLVNLDLRHSRRTLLRDTEETPLSDNQEERDIFSVIPSLHLDVTASGELVAYSDLTKTRYHESELRDADRTTYGVDYLHNFSPVDQIQLQLNKIESDFINFPQANYDLNSATLAYIVTLRKLSYSLGVGQDKSLPEIGEEISSTHYEAFVGYNTGPNQLSLSVDQSVTDSSFGQGLEFIMTELPGVDAVTNEVELIKRRSSSISWKNTALCIRCDIELTLSRMEDDYLYSDFETIQKTAAMTFSYKISNRTTLAILYVRNHEQPVEGDLIEDSNQSLVRYSLKYNFLRSFNMEIFAEREKRESDDYEMHYVEDFIGLSLGYHFE